MFRFALKPIEQALPWGEPGDQNLHWFGLTDGYYFIVAGEERILWYSEAGCRQQGWEFPTTPAGFDYACGYQVCRLFEDLAQILPWILETVPADIAETLSTAESHRDWNRLVARWEWADDDDEEVGLLWAQQRTLDTSYLRAGPRTTFWREGNTIRLRCDNRNELLAGVQIWSSELVEFELPIDEFIAQVKRFGDRLLKQMDERTQRFEAGLTLDGIDVDPVDLRHDHESRIYHWNSALSRVAEPTDWDFVRRAHQA